MGASILWHDYETWGVDPRRDFPVQFAAIRTDLDLNPIGKPLNFYCQIPNDYLPHPEACLVTGITPQQSLRDGYLEVEFAKKIAHELNVADTCSAGYNSIKFDEEVTRHLFYRNFLPVYEREYQNGNSRWDIIDLVRACYALRPEGMQWPYHDDGKPNFKLEALSQANSLEHGNAHEALSDVRATIALAKLIKDKQPKLYDYYWRLRDKNEVAAQIDLQSGTPFLHISGFIPSVQGCCTWLMPITMHNANKNMLIAIDLNKDISLLTDNETSAFDDEEAVQSFYEEKRVPLSKLALNKIPFVAPAKTLSPANAERLGIDRQRCLDNFEKLKNTSELIKKCQLLSQSRVHNSIQEDVDTQLYARGFLSPADNEWTKAVSEAVPNALSGFFGQTDNALLSQQLLRYIGRNYPSSMSEKELERWQMHRREKFTQPQDKKYLSIEAFSETLHLLAQTHAQDTSKLSILRELERYASEL